MNLWIMISLNITYISSIEKGIITHNLVIPLNALNGQIFGVIGVKIMSL